MIVKGWGGGYVMCKRGAIGVQLHLRGANGAVQLQAEVLRIAADPGGRTAQRQRASW